MTDKVRVPARSEKPHPNAVTKKQHAEQPVDYGRDARERFGGDAHQLYQPVAATCVFHKINCREQTQRYGNKKRKDDHDDRCNHGWQQGYIFRVVFPREQRERKVGNPFYEDVSDQKEQRGKSHG